MAEGTTTTTSLECTSLTLSLPYLPVCRCVSSGLAPPAVPRFHTPPYSRCTRHPRRLLQAAVDLRKQAAAQDGSGDIQPQMVKDAQAKAQAAAGALAAGPVTQVIYANTMHLRRFRSGCTVMYRCKLSATAVSCVDGALSVSTPFRKRCAPEYRAGRANTTSRGSHSGDRSLLRSILLPPTVLLPSPPPRSSPDCLFLFGRCATSPTRLLRRPPRPLPSTLFPRARRGPTARDREGVPQDRVGVVGGGQEAPLARAACPDLGGSVV